MNKLSRTSNYNATSQCAPRTRKHEGCTEKLPLSRRDPIETWRGSSMAKINELKYDLLRHLFYSPELAVSDSRLFPRLKKFLAEKKFERKQLIEAAREYFPNLDKAEFSKKKK